MAHLVDGHVAAFVHDLGGHDHNDALFHQLFHLAQEVAGALLVGDAADTVAFQDDGVVMLPQEREDVRVDAGGQLQQEDPRVHRGVKGGVGAGAGVLDVEKDLVVPDGGKVGEVQAVKGVVAFGSHLAGPGAGDDLAVKHQVDVVGLRMAGKAQGVQKVGLGVGDL